MVLCGLADAGRNSKTTSGNDSTWTCLNTGDGFSFRFPFAHPLKRVASKKTYPSWMECEHAGVLLDLAERLHKRLEWSSVCGRDPLGAQTDFTMGLESNWDLRKTGNSKTSPEAGHAFLAWSYVVEQSAMEVSEGWMT